jgi:hypothetical protein
MRRVFLLATLIFGGFCGLEGTLVAQCIGSAGADPSTICPGQSVRLAAGPAIGPCLWSPSEGVTDPLACTTTAQPSHTTQYIVIYTEFGGCHVTREVSVNVLPPAPAPTITAPASALPGQVGLAASVPLHEGRYFASTYKWTIFNGEITSGQGTHVITFSAARNPVKADGMKLGIQLSVVESPIGACDSEAATTTVALVPLRNSRAIPFR